MSPVLITLFVLLVLVGAAFGISEAHKRRALRQISNFDPDSQADMRRLVRLLHAPSSQVRRRAREFLFDAQQEASITLSKLIEADTLPNRSLKRVLHWLRESHHPRATPAVLHLIEHPNADIRALTADVMGEFKSYKVRDVLTQKLEDPSINVRFYAALSAAWLAVDDERIPHIILEWLGKHRSGFDSPDLWERAASRLAEMDDKAKSALIEYLHSRGKWSVSESYLAAYVLANIADKSTIDDLASLVFNKAHPMAPKAGYFVEISRVAAAGLARMGEDGIQRLFEGLQSKDSWIARSTAPFGLASTGDEEYIPQIRANLSDPMPQVRAGALFGLREYGTEDVLPDMLNALDDRHWGVRDFALEALAEYDSEEARAAIQRATKDRHPRVRRTANTLLQLLRDYPHR